MPEKRLHVTLIAHTPEAEKVIAMERENLAKAEEKLARIEESIRNLG